MRLLTVVLAASISLALHTARADAGTTATTTYWSAARASHELGTSRWAKTRRITDPSCRGAGAHIHSPKGTPLFRYFTCFAVRGRAKDLQILSVWVAAGNPALVIDGPPGDLWDNPLAPVPPRGFRVQYLNPSQAEQRFLASPYAHRLRLAARKSPLKCAGEGFHYHLVGQTVYRTFECSSLGPITIPRKTKTPQLSFGKTYSAWLVIARDGTATVVHSAPAGLWVP